MEPAEATAKIWDQLDPDWSIVCREKHAPNDTEKENWTTEMHIHCVIRLKKRREWKKANCMDFITGTHGNYQSARNTTHVALYVTKGTDYVLKNIDLKAFKKAATQHGARVVQKGQRVADMICNGKTMNEIEDHDRGYFMNNMKKIKAYQTHVMARRKRGERKMKWILPRKQDASCEAGRKIVEWMRKNILVPRRFKQKQLWVYGPKNCGKTSMLRWLEDYVTIYDIPQDKWDDSFTNGEYDLAIFDEFRGAKTIGHMNRFVQGGRCPLLRRNLPVYTKMDNLPVIILDNYSIKGCYPKTGNTSLEAIQSRFLEVEVMEGDFIDFYRTRSEKEEARKRFGGQKRKGTRKRKRERDTLDLNQKIQKVIPKKMLGRNRCCHRRNYCSVDHGGVRDFGLCDHDEHNHKEEKETMDVKKRYKVFMEERIFM